MTILDASPLDFDPKHPLRALGRVALLAVRQIHHWQDIACQRRQLLALGDRERKDIGISAADAVREGSRPFWQVPKFDPGEPHIRP